MEKLRVLRWIHKPKLADHMYIFPIPVDEPVIAKQKGNFLLFHGNLADTRRKIYDVAHFPGVIGAIDCTHIRIICPNKENAMAFVN